MEPACDVATMVLGGKVIGGILNKIKGSTWFRMLADKERGLVVQTVEEMVKARETQVRAQKEMWPQD